jgi:hypothetical protein
MSIECRFRLIEDDLLLRRRVSEIHWPNNDRNEDQAIQLNEFFRVLDYGFSWKIPDRLSSIARLLLMRSEFCAKFTCARNSSQENRTANAFPSHLRSAVSSSIDFVPPGLNFHDSPRFDAFLFSSQNQSHFQSKPIQTKSHFQLKPIQTNSETRFVPRPRPWHRTFWTGGSRNCCPSSTTSCVREKAIQTSDSGRGSADRTAGQSTAMHTTGGCLTYSVLIRASQVPFRPVKFRPAFYCVVLSRPCPIPCPKHHITASAYVQPSFGPTQRKKAGVSTSESALFAFKDHRIVWGFTVCRKCWLSMVCPVDFW